MVLRHFFTEKARPRTFETISAGVAMPKVPQFQELPISTADLITGETKTPNFHQETPSFVEKALEVDQKT